MHRRTFLGSGAAALSALAAPAIRAQFARSDAHWSDEDYAASIVVDGLGNPDDPYAPTPKGPLPEPLRLDLKASGATAFHMTVGAGDGCDALGATITNIRDTDRMIEANPDLFLKARSAADIRRAKAERRIALLYGFQEQAAIGTDLDRIGFFKGMGVRFFQLTYNTRNLYADGALEPANAGLSKLGHEFIQKVEEARALLDLSHGGQRSIMEAITAASRPPIITHTGCRALYDHPRNVGDAELRALADKGGVVGIYWVSFLSSNCHPTGADVVRHLEHAVNVCGEDHVAIGTDGMLSKRLIDDRYRAFQLQLYRDRTAAGIAAPCELPGVFNIIPDWDGPRRFALLSDALSEAGWRPSRIRKILGENLLRIYAEVWGS